jgi:deoxyadenosine/deoxycytidine kinase
MENKVTLHENKIITIEGNIASGKSMSLELVRNKSF